MGVDGATLRTADLNRSLQALPDLCPQADGFGVDLQLWRFGQAQSFEELLNGSEARRGRPLHRVSPAVGLVPVRDRALLEESRRLVGRRLGFAGHLARRDRPF